VTVESKRAYERVLGIVDANTSNTAKGPLLPLLSLKTIANHANLSPEEVRKAITVARRRQELVLIEHDGRQYVVQPELPSLRDAVRTAGASSNPDRDRIARLNRAIAAVKALKS